MLFKIVWRSSRSSNKVRCHQTSNSNSFNSSNNRTQGMSPTIRPTAPVTMSMKTMKVFCYVEARLALWMNSAELTLIVSCTPRCLRRLRTWREEV